MGTVPPHYGIQCYVMLCLVSLKLVHSTSVPHFANTGTLITMVGFGARWFWAGIWALSLIYLALGKTLNLCELYFLLLLKYRIRSTSTGAYRLNELLVSKFMCWNPNPQMWWYLAVGPLGGSTLMIGVSSVQFSSVAQSSRLSVTPWTAAHQASLSITNSRSLLKLMSIESRMPSNHLILCCPLLLLPSIFPRIRVFSNESVLCIRWPKNRSFSFGISLSHEYSGLISFRIDWFGFLAVQGTLKSLL